MTRTGAADSNFNGPTPALSADQIAQVKEQMNAGVPPAEVAGAHGISRRTAYRYRDRGEVHVFGREWRASGEESIDNRSDSDKVVAEYQAGYSVEEIVLRLGIGSRRVSMLLTQAGGRAALRGAFQPACMSPDELERWKDGRQYWTSGNNAITPCHDCPREFAAEQRALGRCNGRPGFGNKEQEQPAPAPATRILHVRAIEVRKEPVTLANVTLQTPCATCAHQPICIRITSLRRLASVPVEVPAIDGIEIKVEAHVDCDAYMKAPKSHKPAEPEPAPLEKPKRVMSPEGRANVAAAAQRRWHPAEQAVNQ